MAGGAPELVIPVRLENAKAVAGLHQVGTEGKKAGDQVAQGMGGAGAATKNFGGELAGLMKAQIGLAVIKQAAVAISDQYRDASQHVMQMAKEFQALRRSMQEVATLRGEANTSKFTLAEAEKAQQFNLTPQERQAAQAEFLNFAGAQIGNEQGKKLTGEQAEEFSSRIAVMMKSAGYAPAAGMMLGGSILQQKKGPQNVNALMKEFSTAFNVMEKGQVAIGRGLPRSPS